MPGNPNPPRNYFLNESHELSVEEKSGGGRFVEYPNINWNLKSKKLHESIARVSRRAAQSRDPLSKSRYYLVADPETQIVKASTAKHAVGGLIVEPVKFSGEQSKLFERLGLDLIEVHPSGEATVHASPERMEALMAATQHLGESGRRQQARYVALQSFEWLAGKWKFDQSWADEIGKRTVEGYIKLQPLITELEADQIFGAVARVFAGRRHAKLTGKGRSYMGRYYLKALLDADLIMELAEEFTSIQSIHPPIIAVAEAVPPQIGSGKVQSPMPPNVIARLPCVAMVDTAVPLDHDRLKAFRRGGVILGLNCANTVTDNHGSIVASRIVFGDIDLSSLDAELPPPTCRFLEVRVGTGTALRIHTESVSSAIATALSSAPDVRVFNLSIDGSDNIDDLLPKQRAETLKLIEEVDNLAFDNDVLIVVAAGNSQPGNIPASPYPLHVDEDGWKLRTYPRAFNAITCGGIARRLTAGGVASEIDAPSAFTRIGPGFAGSTKPDFCDSAGDVSNKYQLFPGGGTWGLGSDSIPRETAGTSLAAPVLAREAAFLFDELRSICPGESRPFSCTVKAILAISADDVASRLSEGLKLLAGRTIGFGLARAKFFENPVDQRARFVWQGVVEHEDDVLRVQIPVPAAWIGKAELPTLSLCVAWDTPVNAAAEAQWSCRDVEAKVLPGPDAKALHGSRGRTPGYPLFKRIWHLEKAREKGKVEGDFWIVEMSYVQRAAYAAGHSVPPSQRVAFVAEIFDQSEMPVSPHEFIQSLPIASSLTRLSNTSAWIQQPITIASEF